MMTNKKNKLRELIYIALFAVIIAICSWISIPATVPFTLQTFAVFCTVGLLGGKRASYAVAVYILLGVLGLPVFSSFTGGAGVLLGVTGGYIFGFVFLCIAYMAITSFLGEKTVSMVAAMTAGLVLCYTVGTIWFVNAYTSGGAMTYTAAVSACVLPFIIPDFLKMAAAVFVVKRLKLYIGV